VELIDPTSSPGFVDGTVGGPPAPLCTRRTLLDTESGMASRGFNEEELGIRTPVVVPLGLAYVWVI